MKQCPICKSTKIRFVLKIAKIWKKECDVLFCDLCHLFFLKSKPRLKEIITYYPKHYDIYKYQYSHLKKVIKSCFRFFRCLSQFTYIDNIINTENFSVLEIGAYEGLLLNMFKKNNKVLGTEYASNFIKIAKKKYNVRLINKNFEDLTQKFDLILMSHVFEHFFDIHKAIKNLIKRLKPNGYLFIELPNSPVFSGKVNSELDKFLQTTHIYNFSLKNLLLLFKKSNLKIIDINRFYYNLPNFYNIKIKKNISVAINNATGLNIFNLLPLIHYFLSSLFKPAYSYKKISLNTPWLGLGDNIRLIVQKKQM